MLEIDRDFWIGRYVEIVTWKGTHILALIIDLDHDLIKTEHSIIPWKDIKEMNVIDLSRK